MRIPNLKPMFSRALALVLLSFISAGVYASSHMDAPLITLDPAANTTDVYAFLSQRQTGTNDLGEPIEDKFLTVALSVYPFEEPGEGPNNFRFDDNVLYQIHICKTNRNNFRSKTNDLAIGKRTISYQFRFKTQYRNRQTILNSYLGVINDVADDNQNMIQTYQVTRVNHQNGGGTTLIGEGTVPPNNGGVSTPFYNQGDSGDQLAREGVSSTNNLDRYTFESIAEFGGYRCFAGQRDDGFYGDISAIFDLLQFRSPGVDSQGGYNVHTIVLEIPISEIGGTQQVVGVYATCSRRQMTVIKPGATGGMTTSGNWVQVARQGNPLFNELFVALADKDKYNRTAPTQDKSLFQKYALNPEPAFLFSTIVAPLPENLLSGRTDLATVFIPDIIKVDLSTAPARLAGGGDGAPNSEGFSRLSFFGNDTLISSVATNNNPSGVVPGGWPNGRRFGDDVVDIAMSALVSDLRDRNNPQISVIGDNVDRNDVPFNTIFPYAPTPNNGRVHGHHGVAP